jgi:tetratricopeptide (TPR) repeat protein
MRERLPGALLLGTLWIGGAVSCRHPGALYSPPTRPVEPPPPPVPGPPLPASLDPDGSAVAPTERHAGLDSADRERFLKQADLVLDALESRSPAEAAREADRLQALFPGHGGAELMDAVLRRRIERLKSLGARQGGGNTAAAKQELARAQSLSKEGQTIEARSALERAHVLDSGNLEIEEEMVNLLKKLGLELYGKGDSTLAVSFWRRVLEIRPREPEALRFIQRAEEVLRKR